jgi:phage/plasmid primase-like uncharacterized protein
MLSVLRQCLRSFTACILVTLFAVPSGLSAQVHVVNPADLQQQIAGAKRARMTNMQAVRNFLSSDRAQSALHSAHIDAAQVKTGIATLTDSELSQLAARANHAQADFAAGTLSDRDLIIVLIAIAALILIIVAVHH